MTDRVISVLKVALGATVLAGILVFLTAPVASAHVGPTVGTSTIRQDGPQVRYTLQMAYQRMTDAAQLGPVPPEPQEAERVAFLEAHRTQLAAYLASRVIVELDGVRCATELDGTGVTLREAVQYARADLVYRCPRATGEFAVRYEVFAEADSVGADHTSIVDYELGGGSGRDIFDTGRRELRVGGSAAAEAGPQGEVVRVEPSPLASLARFATLGLEHILSGVDHVLFVVLLLLGAQNWRNVIQLVTTFTVAHSVTLALAALGWVRLPSGIVEPLIALSIVYVAVENIARKQTRYRLVAVFGFGLLHGMGFASALDFTGDSGGRLIGSLLSFNLGIELGQLAVVFLVFPLLLLARRYSWSSVAQTGAAAVVGVVGLVWLVQRVLLASSGVA